MMASSSYLTIGAVRRWAGAFALAAFPLIPCAAVQGQTLAVPALQRPTVSERDYTVALVGGGGTGAVAQWREAMTGGTHWQLEAGLADPTGRTDPMLLMGIGVAREVATRTSLNGRTTPFDMVLTGGASLALGGAASVVRVPVGVSIGRGFALDEGMRLTPFVHPRLSFDYCARCGVREGSRSTLSVNADLGAAWQFDPRWELLAALTFTGSELVTGDQTLSIGVRFVPETVRRNMR